MDLSAELIDEIDAVINKAMQTWNVPGLALAIVKDDQVVLSKGYGVREMDQPEKVDEHTLFAIGSNTKAFTARRLVCWCRKGNRRRTIQLQNTSLPSDCMTHMPRS